MNEEEKKAVEFVKKRTKELKKYAKRENELVYDDIILNLINKLQKENEELKEYIAIAPNLDEMTATKYRNIQQDAYIQGRAEEQQKAKQMIYENYISKEKIKNKIEELNKKEKKELKGMKGQDRYFVKQTYQNKRMILQELIKESE